MALPAVDERRLFLGADRLRFPAARPEPATRGRVRGARQIALEQDRPPLPLDRRDGTAQVWSARGLQDLFARHQRIWLVSESIPASNEPEVTTYLRQEMDVVYESYRTALFLRDNKDRTALHRLRDQRALERSR